MIKTVVVGECCIDEYIYGKCERVCPEAAALCFKRSGDKPIKTNLGMAGNVLNNIISICSDMQCDLLCNPQQHNPITKRRFVDEKYNTIVFREDINDRCKPWDEDISRLRAADYIVISDYNKGFLTHDHYRIIRNASPDAIIFADTKKRIDVSIAEYVNFIKINTDEYNNNVTMIDQILKYCEMIVTGGSSGCKLLNKTGMKQFCTESIEIRDVCGAGDTFLAALLVKYIATKDIIKSIPYANQMAGRVVRKFGVVTP